MWWGPCATPKFQEPPHGGLYKHLDYQLGINGSRFKYLELNQIVKPTSQWQPLDGILWWWLSVWLCVYCWSWCLDGNLWSWWCSYYCSCFCNGGHIHNDVPIATHGFTMDMVIVMMVFLLLVLVLWW
jgi:hypothetical protein